MANKGSARLTRERVTGILKAVLAVWEPAYAYRLVGTAAAVLQGVGLPARDIDILCREREAVDRFAAAMAGFRVLQAPAWLAGDRQYYGNYDVGGVEIGASTVEIDVPHDTAETLGDGPWRHFLHVPVGEHIVPAVKLELRLATEILRRRRDRSEPLIAFLRTHGCDTELVVRALRNAGVPERTRRRVLTALTPEQ